MSIKEFHKYIDSKIERMPEIANLQEQMHQLANEYWKVRRQLKEQKEQLKSEFLHNKNERAKLKKQFDLERSLQILREAK